jgi:hypothetical protein
MAIFNKAACIQVLQAMLADQKNPVIYYVRNNEQMSGNRWKHTYRFFIQTNAGLYNVSGAITAAFGVNVTDRSQTYSINILSPDDDLKSFQEAIRKFTDYPELILEDLISSAKETLEFVINPSCFEFMPVAPLPSPERDSKNREPVNPVLPS